MVLTVKRKAKLTSNELIIETRINSKMGISWNIAEKFDELS